MATATLSVRASGWRHSNSLSLPGLIAAFLLLAGGTRGFGDGVEDALVRAARLPPTEAARVLSQAGRNAPDRADLLTALSRALSESVDAHAKKKEKAAAERAARLAVEKAERAVALDAKSSAAHLALAIACGKLTDFSDNTTKMRLSRRIRDEAQEALALNAGEDLAHHILGRWHYGIATLNPMLKLAARVAYGALPPASLKEAAEHLEKAVALKPNLILHRKELAVVYREAGEKEKAAEQWKAVTALPAADEEDKEAQRQARKALGQ